MNKHLLSIIISLVCVYKLYSTEIVITPTGDDDATLIQNTLDALKDGDTLVHEEKPEGLHIIIFDGSHLSRGIYFYKLHAGDIIASRKFVLM